MSEMLFVAQVSISLQCAPHLPSVCSTSVYFLQDLSNTIRCAMICYPWFISLQPFPTIIAIFSIITVFSIITFILFISFSSPFYSFSSLPILSSIPSIHSMHTPYMLRISQKSSFPNSPQNLPKSSRMPWDTPAYSPILPMSSGCLQIPKCV
jgi:hypothetical protein